MNEADRITNAYKGYSNDPTVTQKWARDNAGNRAIIAERGRVLAGIIRTHRRKPLSEAALLEIGCGEGRFLEELISLGAEPRKITGIDLLMDRIAEARSRFPAARFLCMNADELESMDRLFDIVVFSTVFSSILDPGMRETVAIRADRVLAIDGAILWYDFRYDNPSNRNVRGVTRRDITSLFPDYSQFLRTVTLLPPIARRLGSLTKVLYPVLAAVPMLRTHYIGLLVRKEKVKSK